jgi:L-amino acid N-acyltransferase YncA
MLERLIRAATLSDVGAVRDIYAHFVLTTAASFELEVPDITEMERRFHGVVGTGMPYLVVEVSSEVVGFACASQFRPRPAYRYTVEDSVYVRADMAGRGIGGQLLEKLVERCRAAGFHQMIAVIGGKNPASVALHARAGFREAGTLYGVGSKFGEWHDLTLMQKEL